jgi:hypothetical protein
MVRACIEVGEYNKCSGNAQNLLSGVGPSTAVVHLHDLLLPAGLAITVECLAECWLYRMQVVCSSEAGQGGGGGG